MALSGSVSTNAATGDADGRYYTLSWSATQSIANNTSTISWTLSTAGGTVSYYTERTLWVKIDGATVYSKTAAVNRYKGTIASGTKTIAHNNNGTRSFTVELQGAVYYASINCTGSKTFTLDTIARASGLSVSDGTLNAEQTITADRKSSSFTHTLTWECGSYSGTLATKSTATSWKFTPALTLATGAPYGTKVYCSFKLSTYNGDTLVGSTGKAVWYTIPDSVKPSCSLSLSDSKGYATTYGGYVQGQSKLTATVNATTAQGSPIAKYSTAANGITYTSKSFTTETFATSGSKTISTTVTDGRGRTGTASYSITVIAYTKPAITNVKVRRCDADGTENVQGSYGKITFHCKITSLSNKNSKACNLQYRQSGATSWTDAPAITLSSYDQDCTPPVIAMADDHSYELRITATDAFGSVQTNAVISTAYCLYHVPASGKGITFGGVAEGDGFNVKMAAVFTQRIEAGNQIYMGGIRKVDDEKQIYFQSTNDATYPHSICFFGGKGSSKTAVGVYDFKNSRTVAAYNDADNLVTVYQGAHFAKGLTENIPVLTSGDCNLLTTSGTYYIGGSVTNKPGSGLNGWLTVKAYGTTGTYCCQDYVTYNGARYRRMRDNGTWGSWIQEADFVVESGTSSNWKYQKWNSGVVRAWRQTTSSNMAAVQDGGVNGWYYRIYTIALPSGMFKTITSAMCNCTWGTGISFASARNVTTTSFEAVYLSNQNGGAGTFWHEVTGTWK